MIKAKKGFTMTELMFSIVIISIVMAFLIKLLIDINYDKTNELYDTANNINRSEIIKQIQSDFMENNLKKATVTNNTITLTNINNKSSVINITKTSNDYYINYISISEKKYKWKLNYNNNETHIYDTIIYTCQKKENNYLIMINIPIIVDNSKDPIIEDGTPIFKDSKLDDITLTFYTTQYEGSCENI